MKLGSNVVGKTHEGGNRMEKWRWCRNSGGKNPAYRLNWCDDDVCICFVYRAEELTNPRKPMNGLFPPKKSLAHVTTDK